jgi:hypothetical protein
VARIVYVGLDNKGGPAAIGKYLQKLAERDGHEYIFATYFKHHGEREGWAHTLEQVSRGPEPDIIIFHQWVSSRLMDRWPGVPTYWLPMFEDITARAVAMAQSHALAVIAPTEAVSEFFTELGAEVHYTPWSVDKGFRTRGGSRRYWFFPARTGGHRGRKNVGLFLRAFRQANFKETPRVLISMMPGAWKKHKLPEGCEFVWADSQEEYQQLIRKAGWLVSPSRTSGIELSVLDALHDGIRVLGTDCHPFRDHIYGEWNGVLAPAEVFDPGPLGIPKFEDGEIKPAYAIPHETPTLEGLVAALERMESEPPPRIDFVGLAARKEAFEKFWSQLFRRTL